MKNKLKLILAVSILSSNAAFAVGVGSGLGFECAPEVVNGNIAATKSTLARLKNSPEFKGANIFTEKANALIAEKDAKQFMTHALPLIGVAPGNKQALVDLAGAREIKPEYQISAEKSLDLTPAQSHEFVKEISKSLFGTDL